MIDLVLQNPRIPAGRFDHPLRRTNRPSQRAERSTQLQQVLARDLQRCALQEWRTAR
jgi:hypothetical protein